MGKVRGLKLFPGSKRVKQKAENMEPPTLEGRSPGISTSLGKQKSENDAVATGTDTSKQREDVDHSQTQLTESILAGQCSLNVSEANSQNLEHINSLKSLKQTARKLAGKIVQRTLHTSSQAVQQCSSGRANVQDSKVHRRGRGNSSKAFQPNGGVRQENSLLRLLRSHTPKAHDLASKLEVKTSEIESEKKKRQHQKLKKESKESCQDDLSRINKRVRYLMNRMNREQNLIDVYSAEGWRGKSLEKIRPEKELKRAETQILQCKLAIRQAIQQLDSLGLEGSIQESAFDPEGQIYHDDIFCAKCKSEEVFPENDIILCDGACNRAFHQFCLEPPLRTEDIPPGDEGWLCPACDCKFECLDIINDYFATDYQVEDSWEKIFAEAAVEASGDVNLVEAGEDWPSEDSEDDDYNPDGEIHHTAEKALEHDASVNTSDSSSLNGEDSESDSSDDSSGVSFFDEFAGTSRSGSRKGVQFDGSDDMEELALENEDDVVLVSGKRQRPEVDYKKLYDEVYGANASDNDQSEDDDWGTRKRPRKVKQSDGATVGDSSEQKPDKAKQDKNGAVQGTPEVSQAKKSSTRLPTHAVEKLREVFKEYQLPSKACKENLSNQLGISSAQVNLWFRNARRAALKKGLADTVCAQAKGSQGPFSDVSAAGTFVSRSPVCETGELSAGKEQLANVAAVMSGEENETTKGDNDVPMEMERMGQAESKIEDLNKTSEEERTKISMDGDLVSVTVAEVREKVPEVTMVI